MKHFFIFLALTMPVGIAKSQDFVQVTSNFIEVKYSAVAWGDIDKDGDLDVFICGDDANSVSVSKIYENKGGGNFVEIVTTIPGFSVASAEWGDFNNDTYIDLLVQGNDGTSGLMKIFKNNGDNTFTALPQTFPPVYMGDVAWVDFNKDGNLDLSFSGFRDEDPYDYISKIYKNNGDETFTELAAVSLPGTMYGKFKWADYNNDTYPDFILTGYESDFVTKLYKNNGDETFTEVTTSFFQCWLGDVEWADYDGDGNIDLIVSGTGGSGVERRTTLYKNNGDETFTATTDVFPGVSHSSIEWADFDNDGDLDLYISGTQDTPGNGSYSGTVFLNNNNIFSELTTFAKNYWGETTVADYDNDGKPDILITGLNENEVIFSALYQNKMANLSVADVRKELFIFGSDVVGQLKISGLQIIENISIIDISGKIVFNSTPKSKTTQINVSGFVSGMYIVKITSKNKEFTKKIIVNI